MIDFTQPICTSHARPLVGEYRGERKPGQHMAALPSLSQAKPGRSAPCWFYEASGDRERESDPSFALVNFDPRDGVRHLELERKR